MNTDPNRSSRRKEKQMNAITKTASVAVLITLGLALAARTAEPVKSEPAKAEPQKGKDGAGAAEKTLTIDLGGDVKMEFILIPAGSFVMGSDEKDYEKPPRKVTFAKPFCLGKYEVTQAQWDAVMGKWKHHFLNPRHPVESATWVDCQAFVNKLKERAPGREFRLPSEAEWEYACRAGSTTRFSFGNDEKDLDDHAWHGGNAKRTTHPVGQKKPNAWGLHDMHGNVWEWCQDVWHDNYQGAPSDGSARTDGDQQFRVLRGGSWEYLVHPDLRSSNRILLAPDYGSVGGVLRFLGLRVAAPVEELKVAAPIEKVSP
jgi:formylglycine-generating enzyme required for sulfatase activity